jgi:putative ABC transport system permease protein
VDLDGPSFLSQGSGRYTIIGVLPPQFWLFYSRTDFVVPMRPSAEQLNDPKQRLVETVIARLDTATPEVVRSDIAAITRQIERQASASHTQPASIEVTSVREWQYGDLRQSFLFMMGTTVLVALIACANVALVLISRTIYRQREFAIRLAVGASRSRVVRQLLTESILLSALGGCGGILVAAGAAGMVGVLIPSQIMNRVPGGVESLSIDGRVVTITIVATVLTAFVSGLGSLLAFRSSQSFRRLHQTTQGLGAANRLPLQSVLVISQTALAVTLLIAAGLLSRSLIELNSVDLGIREREGLVVWINLNQSRYPKDEDRIRFYRAVFERLDMQPEIRHASGVDMPFYFEWQTVRAGTETNALTEPSRWPEALARAVTSTYFERHGIHLVAGRYFSEQDDFRTSPVAIVSQTFAERYWPGVNPIGRQLRTVSDSSQPASTTVVGVVGDIRSGPQQQPKPIVYRPFQQAPPPWMYVTVEGALDAGGLFSAIRRAVWSVDPDQPLDGASGGPWTLGEMLSDRTERPRLIARVGNALAGVALLLAAIGIYDLLSYSVARRTSEFGVRIALGASAQNVLSMVLRRTLALTGAGIALGFCSAILVMRFLEGMLFGVTPLDPVTFMAAAFLFLAVSLLASLVPARRATTVSPLVALRTE